MRPVTVFGPKQTGSGDPSPDNERPISGYDALGLTRAGKNLLNYDLFKMVSIINGTAVWQDYGMVLTATANDCYTSYSALKIPVTEGIPVVLSWEHSGSGGEVFIFPNGLVNDMVSVSSTKGFVTYMPTAGVTYVTFRLGVSGTGNTATYKNVQLETGTVGTSFKPYQADTYTAQIGQTVYGGRMDWNTGVLTVNLCKITFDGVTPGARVNRTDPGVTHYAYMDAVEMPYPIKPGGLCISNKTTGSISLVLGFGIPESLTGCVPGDDPLTVAAKYNAVLKAWYDAGEPLEIVYEMNEPIITQLTPNDIAALDGINTIYGDGEITVSGRKDILWLTSDIIERVKTLEKAIVSLGGNV
jgi:hypothetical protein